MKFEEEKKWLFDKENDTVFEARVLYQDGLIPVYYRDADESDDLGFYHIADLAICDTEAEAEKRRDEARSFAIRLAAQVKENIKKLMKLSPGIVSRKDYLPEFLLGSAAISSYYSEYRLLCNYILTGMINVGDVSLQKKDVTLVEWKTNKKAIIHTTDGREIESDKECEFALLSVVFGANRRYYI